MALLSLVLEEGPKGSAAQVHALLEGTISLVCRDAFAWQIRQFVACGLATIKQGCGMKWVLHSITGV